MLSCGRRVLICRPRGVKSGSYVPKFSYNNFHLGMHSEADPCKLHVTALLLESRAAISPQFERLSDVPMPSAILALCGKSSASKSVLRELFREFESPICIHSVLDLEG